MVRSIRPAADSIITPVSAPVLGSRPKEPWSGSLLALSTPASFIAAVLTQRLW